MSIETITSIVQDEGNFGTIRVETETTDLLYTWHMDRESIVRWDVLSGDISHIDRLDDEWQAIDKAVWG